jgi:hypothetical protein
MKGTGSCIRMSCQVAQPPYLLFSKNSHQVNRFLYLHFSYYFAQYRLDVGRVYVSVPNFRRRK